MLSEETERMIKVMAEGYADAMMKKNHRLMWEGYFLNAQGLLTSWRKGDNLDIIEKFKEKVFGKSCAGVPE